MVRGGRLSVAACRPSLLLLLEIPHTLGVWPEPQGALEQFVFHVACASITPLFPSPLPAARWARVWPPPGGRSELLTDGVFQNDIPTRLIRFQAPWVERERRIVGGEEPQRRRSAWILPPLRISKAFFFPI